MRPISLRSLIRAALTALALFGLAGATTAYAEDSKTDQDWADCASTESDLAIDACTRLIDQGDTLSSHERALAYGNRAKGRSHAGDDVAAIADLTAALVFEPNSNDMLQARAGAFLRQQRFREAIADFGRIIEINPSDVDTLLSRAMARSLDDDENGAVADSARVISLDPTRSEPHFVIGKISLDRGDIARAEAELDRAIALKKDGQAEYYGMRGIARLYRGALDESKADFEKAIAINPNFADYYSWLGDVERLRGHLDEAAGLFGRAIEFAPNLASNYTGRAEVLLDAKQDEEAAKDLDKAIALDNQTLSAAILAKGTRGDALANRAFAHALRGEAEQALADANDALSLDPKGQNGLNSRGLAHAAKGDYARALSDFSKRLGFGGEIVWTLYYRAQTHYTFGNYDLAIEDFKAVLKLAPDYPAAVAGLANAEEAAKGAASPTVADNDKAETSTSAQTLPPAGENRDLGKRVALVIGNGTYAKFGQLPNPKRDAEKIAETLREAGFTKVTIAEDLTGAGFNEALPQFAGEADGADWAVIYYAGHGLEIDNTNYLVPVDATLATDRDVQFETVPLEKVVTAVDGAKSMRLVILDACRENPFATTMTRTVATRSIGRGLAKIEPDTGTLIAYSAKAGQVAQDGDGENSPYVIALSNRIRTPGLEIGKLFRLVRDDVLAETGRAQEPFTYGSLSGTDMFINPAQQ